MTRGGLPFSHILVKALREDGHSDRMDFSCLLFGILKHIFCFPDIHFTAWLMLLFNNFFMQFHIQPQEEKPQDPCLDISISMPQSQCFSYVLYLCLWLQGSTGSTSKLEQTCDISLMLWMSKKFGVIPLNLFLLSGWGLLSLAVRPGTATKAVVEKPWASVWSWHCISCCCQCQTIQAAC